MKSYLALTGTLFGLFGAFHIWATVSVLHQLSSEPGMVAGRAAIALASTGIAVWAWRLFSGARVPRA